MKTENNTTVTGVLHVLFQHDVVSLTLKISDHQLREVLAAYDEADKEALREVAEAVFKSKETDK